MNHKQRRVEKKQGWPVMHGASPTAQGLYVDALRHHQAGRLDEAVACYGRVLELKPGYPGAHNNLGVALGRQGRLDEAVACYGRALALKPDYPEAHNNLGTALGRQGRLDEAITCFGRALALKPDYPEAHNNLSAALRDQERLDEAVARHRRALALRPGYPEAHNNLGVALRDEGRLDEAITCFGRALTLKPDYPDAHNNLGVAFGDQGRLDEAVACFGRALALKPDYPEAHNNLGVALGKQGRLDEAVARHRRALALKPDYPEAYNNLGIALRNQGCLDEAVACYGRALAFKPDYSEAHNNLGVALRDQGRLDEAVACYGRALALKPDDPGTYNNLGIALGDQGRLDEAVARFGRALAIKPDDPDTHNNLAMVLLARGDMATGWKEYEWRWKTPPMIKAHRNFAQPHWRGEAAQGQTLLIHAEQGFGDTLQFCRYAPLAAARGLRVIMQVPKPLVRLLRCLPRVDLVVGQGETLPSFDLHCPMLSTPLALATTITSIPSAASYLHADEAQVAAWRTRLTAMANQDLRIGLAWAGNPALPADCRRSLAPDRLAPLFDLSGLHFFSLQKGGPAAPEGSPLTDFMEEMGDFADTAALIANLDLVISVDTAVAHLAAALGKPVWLLNRFDSCWRWLAGRRDSPWYPALRLYHQPRPGDWGPVLAEVARDLRTLAGV